MTHELKFKSDLGWALSLSSKGDLVRLLGLLLRREVLLGADSSHMHSLEKVEWLASIVNAANLKLGSLFDHANLDALLHLPGGDLIAELLHEELHDIIALGIDAQSSVTVKRSLLKVANNKATSIDSASLWEGVSRRDTQTRSHGDAEIRVSAALLTKHEDSIIQLLAKVDDCVLEMAIAAWALAHATRAVLFSLLGVAYTMVTHVLAATFLANFEVRVSVQLRNAGGRNATLTMKTIDVLTDDMLEMVLLHQFNHGHMRNRWVCFLNCSLNSSLVSRHLSSCTTSGCSSLLLFSILLFIGCSLPAAWARLKNGVISRAVVGNTAGGGDASASEHRHVLRREDHLGEHGDLLVEDGRLIEVLLLLFFSLMSSVCHCEMCVFEVVCF